jgi:hypothetical protein
MAESQESKNLEIFEQVWDQATGRIEELTPDVAERKFLKSLVMGGTVAAEMVVNGAESARRYWGEGNPAWAAEISQLFSFMMLSQCYRWVVEQDPHNKTAIPKEFSATKLVYAFGTEPEQSLEDFMRFDEQYNYDMEKKPHLVHVSRFVLARMCEIMGHKGIDWEKVKFPVAELSHLAKKGVILDSEPIRSQDDP